MCTDLDDFKLNFFTAPFNSSLNRQILLAIIKKRLIRWDMQRNAFDLTILGKRMASLGLKEGNKGKAIYAKEPHAQDIRIGNEGISYVKEVAKIKKLKELQAKKEAKKAHKLMVEDLKYNSKGI